MKAIYRSVWLAVCLLGLNRPVTSQVFINEIMYHPVERAAFDTNGIPLLDLSGDVHEFIELYNTNTSTVSLHGWRLSGGIDFQFPVGSFIGPGGYVVIAKDPARVNALPQYGLFPGSVYGPYTGQLGNEGDSVRLRDLAEQLIDSVTYSPSFPWAMGANALGADDEWTGLNSMAHQYRGRSLERVSLGQPANDPANWLASPLSTGPTPGRANTVRLAIPRPIVLAVSAGQASDGSILIRSNQPVRIDVTFSGTNLLSNVQVEYFIDDVNLTNEVRSTATMAPVIPSVTGRFAATLPARPNRSVVRYRIRAERGAGLETISPRDDDPQAWHAYFVSPVRTSANPIYDVFIASASLSRLNVNISQTPRRITLPDPPGTPRESWNATEPAIFVHNGVVYDIRMRHHGSRYNRNANRKSYKFQFPDYAWFNGRKSYFETDKGDEHRLGSKLYEAVDLPMWRARFVDIYLNVDALDVSLEQEEVDKEAYLRWIDEQEAKYPERPRQNLGETFKSTGVVPFETGVGQGTADSYASTGEGPYYMGNAAPIPPKAGWSLNERYAWTFGLQVDQWRGGAALRQLIEDLWAARGDTPLTPNPDLPTLRAFLAERFDVDATLTYIAIRNWSAPFDNATHNHFLWRRGDGKWGMLPWDLDAEFNSTRASQSIYWDEYAAPQPDGLRGPQWVKDSFMKAYREEYRQKLFILNNTLLSPAGVTAIGAAGFSGYAGARQTAVNAQLGLGLWYAPQRPTNRAPASAASVFAPASLQASPYLHSAPSILPPAHARTTWLIRPAAGPATNAYVRVTSTTNLTSLPIPFERLTFGEAYFWKCVYFDAAQHPSAESVETSFTYGTAPTPGEIVLSEILADNPGSILHGSTAPDFIEIFNTTGEPKSLTQISLTDDPEEPGKFVFPAGTILAANERLVVWCDRATNAPGLHAGFALDNDGQTVLLFTMTNGAYALADAVTFGLQVPGRSIGRVGGSANWVLTEPTPTAANVAAALAPPVGLKINEWMATSTTGPDWFELHNPGAESVLLSGLYLSDSAAQRTNTRIANLTFIGPGDYRRFYADEDLEAGARHVNFRLSAGGDSIVLSAADLSILDQVSFGPQSTDISQGRLPDGAANITAFPGSVSPEAPNHVFLAGIVINELLPNIELHNSGAAPVDIGGWWLSDDPLQLQKYLIPAGTVISSGGYWQVGQSDLPFQLNPQLGGEVILSRDGGFQAQARFGPSDGRSYGTVTTSLGVEFARLSTPTFGAPNASPAVGPVVISEIQYHPPDLPGDDDDYEFVELANTAAAPIGLHLPGFPEIPWRLRDAVSYQFPAGTVLASGERILVVGFDPATQSPARSNFFTIYTIPPGTRLFGPFSGKLDNAGASVELVEPQLAVAAPGPNYGVIPEVLLERVRYRDTAPWSMAADGNGPSLQRRVHSAYANDPMNWYAANGVSPGSMSRDNTPPTLAIVSPAAGAALPFNRGVTVLAQSADPDADGQVRRVEFYADGLLVGTALGSPYSVVWSNGLVGPHVLTARALDDRLGITWSAAVPVTVSNSPPAVTVTLPLPGSRFAFPTNLLLEASASDLDGVITKVEFFADGARLGEVTAPPYRWHWENARCGILTARATDDAGSMTLSPGVEVANTREITIAYVVEPNVVGSQSLPNPYAIGMDFRVLSPVVLTHLGCFDSGSDGLSSSSTLTTQIFNRNGTNPVVVASTNFSSNVPGELVGGSRFKPMASVVVLTNGDYSVVGYGYDGNNRNGNLGTGNSKAWTTEDGCGLLAFVGGGRYGAVAPGALPLTGDAGPADRYAAGTFQFRPLTPAPFIVTQPRNLLVRPGSTTNLTVLALGEGQLQYQWRFNQSPIPHATNATLSIANFQQANEGAYQVTVSNMLGVVESAPATLTLALTPGFVVRPLDQFVVSNGSFSVSVVITGTPPPFRYEWRESSTPRGVTNSPSRTNIFSFGPVTNLSARQWRIIVTNALTTGPGITIPFNVTALADADADGLPDTWETANGLNPVNPADAAADGDGDGVSNRDEYHAGTHPGDAGSYLKIDSIDYAGAAMLTFGVLSNRTYSVQATESLGLPWATFLDVVASPTNRVERVTAPPLGTGQFFRLVTPARQ